MGVDPKWARFPICPEMSRFIPICPLLSFLRPRTGTNRDKRGHTGTKRDISGQIGKRPHLDPPPFSFPQSFAILSLQASHDKSIVAGPLRARGSPQYKARRVRETPVPGEGGGKGKETIAVEYHSVGAFLFVPQLATATLQHPEFPILEDWFVCVRAIHQSNLSGDTFSIEAPRNLLRTKRIL